MTPEEYVRSWWALYRLGECSTDYVLMRATDLVRVAIAAERGKHGDYRAGDRGFGEPVPCACGCGVLLRPLDGYKRARRFIRGHWIKWALQSYSRSVEEYLKGKGDLE